MYSFGLKGVLLALATLLCATHAVAQEWVVKRATGTGWIIAEGQTPAALVTGVPVPKGSTVQTGPNARAVLISGGDVMSLGPSTVVAIPHRPDRGLATTVLQQVGEVDLQVQKRGFPHFSVQTPFMAAVVKGTEFRVAVSSTGTDLIVQGGLVSVTDLGSGDRAEIGAGQMAAASPQNGGLHVEGRGQVPDIRSGTPQAPIVTPARPVKTGKSNSVAEAASGGKSGGVGHEMSQGSRGRGNAVGLTGGNGNRGGKGTGGNGNRGGGKGNGGGNGGGGNGGNGSGGGSGNGNGGGKGKGGKD